MTRRFGRVAALAAIVAAGIGMTATIQSQADQGITVRLELIGRYDGGIYSHSAVQNPPAWDAGRKHLMSEVRPVRGSIFLI